MCNFLTIIVVIKTRMIKLDHGDVCEIQMTTKRITTRERKRFSWWW